MAFIRRRLSPIRTSPSSRPRWITSAILCILLIYSVASLSKSSPAKPKFSRDSADRDDSLSTGVPGSRLAEKEGQQKAILPKDDRCRHLPGADNVMLILRTGATEALEKLPVQFDTILRCVPHFAVYSDLEESIAGHHVYDAFDEVRAEVKQQNPDFKLYNRLKQHGRQALLSSDHAPTTHGESGDVQNPGWKLDKWKFLPLVDKALRIRPSAQWYVFVEADTYLVWENLLTWLSNFNPDEPHYHGSQMYIGDLPFAQGGGGFIVSNVAMRLVAEHRTAHLEEYDDFTAGHWAGDCVLAKALADVNVHVRGSWPIFQIHAPDEVNFGTISWGKRMWCYPVVSYHTVQPEDIESFWNFERRWFDEGRGILRHSDVFRYFVLPQFKEEREDWDNRSDREEHTEETVSVANSAFASDERAASSFEDCRKVCLGRSDCVQFSYSPRKCVTSRVVRLGRSTPNRPGGIRSGWVLERVAAFADNMEECHGETWDVS